MDATETVLRLEGVTKRFGSFVANDSISFALRAGEIHVLLGENGAGKSTLLNTLYGHLQPDAGLIEVAGRPVKIDSPTVALQLGVGMVHQHFTLVPSFTVAENVLLGRKAALPRERRSVAAVQATADRLGWGLDVNQRVDLLSVAGRQQVELLKLLHYGAKILLMDEPTSLLSPKEIDVLLLALERLAENGAAVLLVTHKLKEVTRVAHRVTVIRHGVVTARFNAGEADETELARAMTGRKEIPRVTVSGTVKRTGRPALDVQGLSAVSELGPVLRDVALAAYPGEIVGIAGVEGNGQAELLAALAGTSSISSGSIVLGGIDMTRKSPRERRLGGLAFVPADRRADGIVTEMTLYENLALGKIACGRSAFPNWGRLKAEAAKSVAAYDIRPANIDLAAGRLSGGNIQKLVLAREIAARPNVLIASSPTWGLDVGAIADVRRRLLAARDDGCAIVLSSPDLDEILELSDRVMVIFRGAIALDTARQDLSMDRLALAMIGQSDKA